MSRAGRSSAAPLSQGPSQPHGSLPASSLGIRSHSPGVFVHLVFHLSFPALGSLPVSRPARGSYSGLMLGSCPSHFCPMRQDELIFLPRSSVPLPQQHPLRPSSAPSQPQRDSHLDVCAGCMRDPRLSTLVFSLQTYHLYG